MYGRCKVEATEDRMLLLINEILFSTKIVYNMFRYPYQHEDRGYYRSNAYPVQASRPPDIGPTTPTNNPFRQGSPLHQEADNVVQMFLMNEANKKSIRQGIMQDQTDFVESITKRKLQPGKVEDLPSPTGPYGEMQVS